MDDTTGHYIVVPAPYNYVYYTKEAFQHYSTTASAITALRPSFPAYKPAPPPRRRRIRREMKKEEGEEEKKKSNPVSIKCSELVIGNYKKTMNQVKEMINFQ